MPRPERSALLPPFFHAGQTPQRVAWPGPVPESLNLDLLELVLRYVGLNEVHKAIGLLLETLEPPPSGLHPQRYAAALWEACWALHPFSLAHAPSPL